MTTLARSALFGALAFIALAVVAHAASDPAVVSNAAASNTVAPGEVNPGVALGIGLALLCATLIGLYKVLSWIIRLLTAPFRRPRVQYVQMPIPPQWSAPPPQMAPPQMAPPPMPPPQMSAPPPGEQPNVHWQQGSGYMPMPGGGQASFNTFRRTATFGDMSQFGDMPKFGDLAGGLLGDRFKDMFDRLDAMSAQAWASQPAAGGNAASGFQQGGSGPAPAPPPPGPANPTGADDLGTPPRESTVTMGEGGFFTGRPKGSGGASGSW